MTNMNRRSALSAVSSGAALLALAGCSAQALTSAQTTAGTTAANTSATISASATQAVTAWGIIKGVAEVALTASEILAPGATTAISAGIAAVDGIVATFPSIATDAEATAAAIGQVFTNAIQVLIDAAPAITAVSNATK